MPPNEPAELKAVPQLMYGTAWKEERTEELTTIALRTGFRAIDTANQRKHYVETAVGAAVRASGLARETLFLQTKFTYARGQDERLPYDPSAEIAEQVQQSFDSSLVHLGVTYVDAYLLHGPWSGAGIVAQDWEAWRTMEMLHRRGLARSLGISNVSAAQLALLCAQASVKPAFVQNRCYARTGWDREVRSLCAEQGIVYQGFSLLTANQRELSSPAVTTLARRLGASVPQLVFRFAAAVGMLPLTGTSDAAHMQQDLEALALPLSAQDVATLEQLAR